MLSYYISVYRNIFHGMLKYFTWCKRNPRPLWAYKKLIWLPVSDQNIYLLFSRQIPILQPQMYVVISRQVYMDSGLSTKKSIQK